MNTKAQGEGSIPIFSLLTTFCQSQVQKDRSFIESVIS